MKLRATKHEVTTETRYTAVCAIPFSANRRASIGGSDRAGFAEGDTS
jgi:hypothetical protein